MNKRLSAPQEKSFPARVEENHAGRARGRTGKPPC
jgi:hypothetical protein